MAQVTLKDVRKVFDKDVVAVDDANIEIHDREFVVLVGPSGCGKSTTLRMVAGLEEMTSGEIHIDGKLVNDIPPKDRDIAMVFQNYALYPHMTIAENMGFSLKAAGVPKEEMAAKVDEAARVLKLEALLDRERRALLDGALDDIGPIMEEKIALIDRLTESPPDNSDAISPLHLKLRRNQELFDQTLAGIRNVAERLGVLRQIRKSMDVYDAQGRRETISAEQDSRLERRA